MLAVGAGAEGGRERAGDLGGAPGRGGGGSGLPIGVGDDAVLLAIGAREVDGSGDGGGCFGVGSVDFVGGDVEEDFVVAGVKEGGDLFAVEGSPLVVMAGDGAIDAGGEVSADEDVEAGGFGFGVEVEAVAELCGRGGGHVVWVGAGEPDPADGAEFMLVGGTGGGDPLGLPVGGGEEAGLEGCRHGGGALAFVVPDDDLPEVALLGVEGSAGVRDVEGSGGVDAAGIPGVGLAGEEASSIGGDEDFVA